MESGRQDRPAERQAMRHRLPPVKSQPVPNTSVRHSQPSHRPTRLRRVGSASRFRSAGRRAESATERVRLNRFQRALLPTSNRVIAPLGDLMDLMRLRLGRVDSQNRQGRHVRSTHCSAGVPTERRPITLWFLEGLVGFPNSEFDLSQSVFLSFWASSRAAETRPAKRAKVTNGICL